MRSTGDLLILLEGNAKKLLPLCQSNESVRLLKFYVDSGFLTELSLVHH